MKDVGEFAFLTWLEHMPPDSARAWALYGRGQGDDGLFLIVDAADAGAPVAVAVYDGATGDVFALESCSAPDAADAEHVVRNEPDVHVIGSLDGENGQVTVRQGQGTYLRACRWDRLGAAAAAGTGALLRTLPQCGCGGSLGAPKLFGSFAEMSAYHFCAFCL